MASQELGGTVRTPEYPIKCLSWRGLFCPDRFWTIQRFLSGPTDRLGQGPNFCPDGRTGLADFPRLAGPKIRGFSRKMHQNRPRARGFGRDLQQATGCQVSRKSSSSPRFGSFLSGPADSFAQVQDFCPDHRAGPVGPAPQKCPDQRTAPWLYYPGSWYRPLRKRR